MEVVGETLSIRKPAAGLIAFEEPGVPTRSPLTRVTLTAFGVTGFGGPWQVSPKATLGASTFAG